MSFDILNKKEFLKDINIKELVRGIPHIIWDDEGKLIFRENETVVTKEEKKEIYFLNPKPVVLLVVQMQADYFSIFEEFVLYSWRKFDRRINEEGLLEKKNIMALDFSRFFNIYINSANVSFNNLIKKCFFLLKSHIPVKELALFQIDWKKGLIETGRIGGRDGYNDVIPLDGKSLESICALSEVPYFSKNCKEENVFKHLPEIPFENYTCFPLFKDKNIVGVLSCIDLIHKDWRESDLIIVKRFCQFLIWVRTNINIMEVFNEEAIEERVLLNHLSQKTVINHVNQELEVKNVFCLWAGIKGTMDLLRGLGTEKIQKLYQIFFNTMVDVVDRFEGEVDDFFGDSIIVKWNARGQGPLSKGLLFEAAQEMQREIFVTVLPKWKEVGIKRFGIGIGIDGGDACIGNLGSALDVKYSALGYCSKNSEILGKMAAPGEILIPEGFMEGVSEEDNPGHKRFLSNVSLYGPRNGEKILVVQPVDCPDYTKIKST